MSKVMIMAHPDTGAVITPTKKNPEIGSIRVESVENVFSASGFFSEQKRVAFITGKISELENYLKSKGLSAGDTMVGKIVQNESFDPFYPDQDIKRYPDNHVNAGEPVLTNGRPTYLRRVFTTDLSAQDKWVDNSVKVETTESIEQQAI